MKLLNKVILLVSIACLIAGMTCADAKAKDKFGFYYGNVYSDQWNDYEKLIIDVRNFSQDSGSTGLSETSARLITYISIGETDTLIEGDKQGPGGYASWYLDKDGDGASWSWTYLQDVVSSILNNTIMTEIDPSSIETGNNTLISAMAASLNYTWAIQDMTNILRGVTEVSHTDVVYLIEDEKDKSIKGHQDIKRLTSTDSASELIVEMLLRKRPRASNHYIIFIDTDGVYGGYGNYEITASHMVMDGELYRYYGDGDSWDWVYIRSVNVVTSRKKLTYTLDKLDVELITGSYDVMGEVLDKHWNNVDYTGMLPCSTNY